MSQRLMLVLALAAVACQGGGRSAPAEPSLEDPPSESALVAALSVTAEQRPEREAVADVCPPGQTIASAVLAASWPKRIGQRVRLRSHVERSLDLLDALVVAGGNRFVVVLGPDQLWSGDEEHTFTVMGARTVALHGMVSLPQLLLDEECSP